MKARLPQGYGGGAQNMQQIMKQAQQMQDDMAALQTELDATEYEVTSGGGMVKLKINGKREVVGLNIDKTVVDPEDIEMLEDLVMAAFNEGVRVVTQDAAAKMDAVTGGMNMPGVK